MYHAKYRYKLCEIIDTLYNDTLRWGENEGQQQTSTSSDDMNSCELRSESDLKEDYKQNLRADVGAGQPNLHGKKFRRCTVADFSEKLDIIKKIVRLQPNFRYIGFLSR